MSASSRLSRLFLRVAYAQAPEPGQAAGQQAVGQQAAAVRVVVEVVEVVEVVVEVAPAALLLGQIPALRPAEVVPPSKYHPMIYLLLKYHDALQAAGVVPLLKYHDAPGLAARVLPLDPYAAAPLPEQAAAPVLSDALGLEAAAAARRPPRLLCRREPTVCFLWCPEQT